MEHLFKKKLGQRKFLAGTKLAHVHSSVNLVGERYIAYCGICVPSLRLNYFPRSSQPPPVPII